MKKTFVFVFVSLILVAYVKGTFSQDPIEQPLIYLLPLPNAPNISPTTSLAIRTANLLTPDAAQMDIFVVTGNKSGLHHGRTVLSDDGVTLLFYPNKPFAYGETVTVTIQPGLKTADNTPVTAASYQFTVREQPISQLLADTSSSETMLTSSQDVQLPPVAATAGTGPETYYTHPEFTNIMTRTVITAAQNTDDGYIFVGAVSQFYSGPAAIMILDDTGEPIYMKATPNDHFVGDFRKQTVNGTDYLTYHTGILPGNYTFGSSYVLDENYQVVDTWTIGNGYGADVHEFLLLDNGHAILMAYVPISFDLTPYGGPADGQILDIVLQEQDADKNVVFEWHASQYLPIDDTEANLTSTNLIDYLHTNALAVDNDGNWLVSHRNFSEITKINRQTGDVIWRMGGKGNEFTFTNDIGFFNQHNINRLENGHITLFDNGTFHTPPHSRAIEYEVDEVAKTVTRVWMYPEDTGEYSSVMSNIQRLPNGNSMIGWGNQSKLSEIHADGTVALEIVLGTTSYRTFRYPWTGTPTAVPRAVLQYDADPTAVTIYTSWNGATDIGSYEIYAGSTITSLALLETVPKSGFETEISLTELPADTCFFQTKPIHTEGNTTPTSNMMFRLDLPVCQDQLSHSYMPFLTK